MFLRRPKWTVYQTVYQTCLFTMNSRIPKLLKVLDSWFDLMPTAGVNLEKANLRGTDLSFADLQSPNLYRASLYRADLRGANLSGALLDSRSRAIAKASGSVSTSRHWPTQVTSSCTRTDTLPGTYPDSPVQTCATGKERLAPAYSGGVS